MTSWLSTDEQRAWRAYRRMVLLVDSAVARDLARDRGLSMPDYLVLSTLSEAVGARKRLTELSGRMQWSASRLSHHVTRMEQRGLVTRADCTEDLRAAYVVLTDAGWDAIRAAAPGHVAAVRAHLVDLLDPAEIAAITSIGEKVAAHFGEGCLDQPDGASQSENASPVSRS
ncbi:MAG: MarR family winged helix-turn-helix transcriptional regulator [Jatrophihabitantaceae bacterium]